MCEVNKKINILIFTLNKIILYKVIDIEERLVKL